MQQYVAPKALIVNGRPSACECIEEPDRVVICAFCVQVNLIHWARENDEDAKMEELIKKIRKYGPRKLAKGLGLSYTMIQKWLKNRSLPKTQISAILNQVN